MYDLNRYVVLVQNLLQTLVQQVRDAVELDLNAARPLKIGIRHYKGLDESLYTLALPSCPLAIPDAVPDDLLDSIGLTEVAARLFAQRLISEQLSIEKVLERSEELERNGGSTFAALVDDFAGLRNEWRGWLRKTGRKRPASADWDAETVRCAAQLGLMVAAMLPERMTREQITNATRIYSAVMEPPAAGHEAGVQEESELAEHDGWLLPSSKFKWRFAEERGGVSHATLSNLLEAVFLMPLDAGTREEHLKRVSMTGSERYKAPTLEVSAIGGPLWSLDGQFQGIIYACAPISGRFRGFKHRHSQALKEVARTVAQELWHLRLEVARSLMLQDSMVSELPAAKRVFARLPLITSACAGVLVPSAGQDPSSAMVFNIESWGTERQVSFSRSLAADSGDDPGVPEVEKVIGSVGSWIEKVSRTQMAVPVTLKDEPLSHLANLYDDHDAFSRFYGNCHTVCRIPIRVGGCPHSEEWSAVLFFKEPYEAGPADSRPRWRSGVSQLAVAIENLVQFGEQQQRAADQLRADKESELSREYARAIRHEIQNLIYFISGELVHGLGENVDSEEWSGIARNLMQTLKISALADRGWEEVFRIGPNSEESATFTRRPVREFFEEVSSCCGPRGLFEGDLRSLPEDFLVPRAAWFVAAELLRNAIKRGGDKMRCIIVPGEDNSIVLEVRNYSPETVPEDLERLNGISQERVQRVGTGLCRTVMSHLGTITWDLDDQHMVARARFDH